jgi:uncharacterized protein
MFGHYKSREGRFFELFQKCADQIVEAAHEFRKLLEDAPNIEVYAQKIKDIEHATDLVTHETVELLHKTFITPIDRDDIHELASRMDDIVDFIDAAAERMYLYGIKKITPEATQLADVCVHAAEYVKKAVQELPNLKNSKEIIKLCIEINRVENEADRILRVAMAKLFREEPDTRELIKLKEIYEILETVTDRCEDVANTIEGIVLEYA